MKTQEIIKYSIKQCANRFKEIDCVALKNQKKVLSAFTENRVALYQFGGTTGYGYDDVGRDNLRKVYASVFNAEDAIVSPSIASGTHAIAIALFGVLRPGDKVLSISGRPYDTLSDVIYGENIGSLKDFGVVFDCIALKENGEFDFEKIEDYLKKNKVRMVYLQRSKGYEWRQALSIEKISGICGFIKKLTDCAIMCDNCYGEFVEEQEPVEAGCDICAGSLIKNIGGGICPTGGYIVGSSIYVSLAAGRLTAPSIGCEVGSYAAGYRNFYQGLFLAPHTVAQALKTSALFSCALSHLGYEVLPKPNEKACDIVCSVKFGREDKLIEFCQSIQASSPIDGFAVPTPWEMPGYSDKVIMAAGCFVQGSSIELSCDAPIKAPFIAYLQGGITLEHGIIALEKALDVLLKN